LQFLDLNVAEVNLPPFALEADWPGGQFRLAAADGDAVQLDADRPIGVASDLGGAPLAHGLERFLLGLLVELAFALDADGAEFAVILVPTLRLDALWHDLVRRLNMHQATAVTVR